jgi:phosphoglycolate phosphatase-like HAD superfamily hydrolase
VSSFVWRGGQPRQPGPAVLVDLDGTLSDATGRVHHLERRPKDWDGFFAAVGDDPLIDQVARLVELLDRDLLVVLLTARPERVRDASLAWLTRHDVRWDALVMREERDFRPAHAVKLDAVRALKGAGFELRLALDDDPRNATMFREEDVPCLELQSGYDP